MKPILELVDDGIKEAIGCCDNLPLMVAGEEFLEFMAEFGVLDEIVDMGDFADAWYTFLAEECDIL